MTKWKWNLRPPLALLGLFKCTDWWQVGIENSANYRQRAEFTQTDDKQNESKQDFYLEPNRHLLHIPEHPISHLNKSHSWICCLIWIHLVLLWIIGAVISLQSFLFEGCMNCKSPDLLGHNSSPWRLWWIIIMMSLGKNYPTLKIWDSKMFNYGRRRRRKKQIWKFKLSKGILGNVGNHRNWVRAPATWWFEEFTCGTTWGGVWFNVNMLTAVTRHSFWE